MKKIIVILFFFFTANGFAQTSFGIQAGTIFSMREDVLTNISNAQKIPQKYKSNMGIMIGAYAEIPVSNNIKTRPELNYVQKKGTYNNQNDGSFVGIKDEYTMNYINVPVNFIYTTSIASSTLFFGLGPVFELGLSGKGKYTFTPTDQSGSPIFSDDVFDYKIVFDGKKNADDERLHFNSLGLGLGGIAGFQTPSGINVNLSYCMGLDDISPEDNAVSKSNALAIRLGYSFGDKSISSKASTVEKFSTGTKYLGLSYGFLTPYKTFVTASAGSGISGQASGSLTSFGPIGVSYEKAVSDKVSIGGKFITGNLNYDYTSKVIIPGNTYTDKGSVELKYTGVVFRGNYHFAGSNSLDPYIGLGLGYGNFKINSQVTDNSGTSANVALSVPSAIGVTAQLGAHYFLNNKIGLFGEVGVLMGSFLQFGVVAKF